MIGREQSELKNETLWQAKGWSRNVMAREVLGGLVWDSLILEENVLIGGYVRKKEGFLEKNFQDGGSKRKFLYICMDLYLFNVYRL